jgi:tRNA pseudouridine55 synthase
MDGLLIVDKPEGPTSHDVVNRVRCALGERRIGHTGTLDPAATGVLALVLGRATRLAQFLSGSEKSYEAAVRFGFATDTGDAQGQAIVGVDPPRAMPTREAIDAALNSFRGTFLQQPPAFSAKKIAGTRSHRLARARSRGIAVVDRIGAPEPSGLPHVLAPVRVTAHAIEIVKLEGDTATLRLDCSAGFYVRALAHDLGEQLGVGAHLIRLRRTRVGEFGIADALAIDTVEQQPERARAAMIGLADMLPRFPKIALTAAGVRRAINGCALGPADMDRGGPEGNAVSDSPVQLIDPAGALVGIARSKERSGLLYPSVILITS